MEASALSKFDAYLGDGVYFQYDGYHYILKTGSHIDPDNTIALDPYVFQHLLTVVEKLKKRLEEKNDQIGTVQTEA